MSKVTFKEDACKGCSLCIDACPKNIIALDKERLNLKGVHPAVVTDMDKCIGCACCALMCPDLIISVEK